MPARRSSFARALEAPIRKPPRKEPVGRRVDGCRLWGLIGRRLGEGMRLSGDVR
jgi:hypothetical protein